MTDQISVMVIVPAFNEEKNIVLPACPCPVSKVLEDIFYPTFRDIVKGICKILERKMSESTIFQKKRILFLGPVDMSICLELQVNTS